MVMAVMGTMVMAVMGTMDMAAMAGPDGATTRSVGPSLPALLQVRSPQRRSVLPFTHCQAAVLRMPGRPILIIRAALPGTDRSTRETRSFTPQSPSRSDDLPGMYR